ncbi:hypothetical protein [Lichenicoccus sp.]|uniref:hypothetical protein n=1 Tax=Lichenicoccus sp. TaxID=2781899 RepID=UPI003D0BD9AE
MATSQPGRCAVWMLVAYALTSLCWDAAAAQTVPNPNGTQGSGVLRPPRHLDPKMSRPAPRMPAQSMPVIRPKTTTKDGTVVVPR